MWKRLNNNKGARPPVISDPVLEDVTYGENVNANTGYNRTQAPPRPPREELKTGLPRLPFEAPSPPAHNDSTFRPASSIYSQPSPNQPTSKFPRSSHAAHPSYTEEVSPPSSPELGAYKSSQRPDEYEVSPIDEMPDVSQLNYGQPRRPESRAKNPSSNIPILRREKRRNQVAAAASNLVSRKESSEGSKGRPTVDPRWDPYSGEITTSDRGKPQSVKPGQFSPPQLRPVHHATGTVLGNESNISGPAKTHTSFGDRVRKLKTHNAPAEKPEWKGGTGRVALVSPVADQPDVPPLSIPRKSSRRVSSPVGGISAPVPVIRTGNSETSSASTQPSEHTVSTIRPVQPNSGENSPRLYNPPTIPQDPAPHPLASNATQIRGGHPTEVKSHQRKASVETIERNFREAFQNVSFPSNDPGYVEPSSRFSVTTYAPSEHSPRVSTSSEVPPMPTPPQTFTTTSQPTPILNRKRPKVVESPKPIMRKAVHAPQTSPVFISMSSRASTLSTTSKTLPLSPAEAESHDLITSLQAQLDDLAHRRNNISRSIRQMTELMPTDSLIVTAEVRCKRDEEKRKVEGLREEEADVRRMEHEIGLRLHRAFKRRDKEAVYEPTGLWVRRVTG